MTLAQSAYDREHRHQTPAAAEALGLIGWASAQIARQVPALRAAMKQGPCCW